MDIIGSDHSYGLDNNINMGEENDTLFIVVTKN